MRSEYYVRQFWRGLFHGGIFLTVWYWHGSGTLEANVICTSLVVTSCLLFPYSTRFFEQLAQATRTFKVWHKLFGVETPRNNAFIMFYHLFCLAFSLPIGGLFFLWVELKRG